MEITGSRAGSVWYPDPVEGYEPKVIEKCDLASLPRDLHSPRPSLDQLPTEWGQWIVHDASKSEFEQTFGFKNSDLKTLSLLSIADTWPALFTDSSGAVHDFYSADELYYYVGLRAKQTAQAKIKENEESQRHKVQEQKGVRSSSSVRQHIRDTLRGAEEVVVR